MLAIPAEPAPSKANSPLPRQPNVLPESVRPKPPATYQQLSGILTGCRGNYCGQIDSDETQGDEAGVNGLVKQAQDGFQVFYYNKQIPGFEWVQFKVNKPLTFWQVLSEKREVGDVLSSSAKKETLIERIRVDQIAKVEVGYNAVQACEAVQASLQGCPQDVHVVALLGVDDNCASANISASSILLIVAAPPSTQLRQCLQAVSSKAPSGSAVNVVAARTLQSYHRNRTLRESLRGSYIESIMLQDLTTIFVSESETFDFEISWKPSGSQQVVRVPTHIAAEDVGQKALPIAQVESFFPICAARFAFVLRDAVALRLWATNLAPLAFQGRLIDFILDAELLASAVPQDRHFAAVLADVARVRQAQQLQKEKGDAMEYYSEASARAAHLVIDQLVSLERTYSQLSEKFSPEVSRISFACEPCDHLDHRNGVEGPAVGLTGTGENWNHSNGSGGSFGVCDRSGSLETTHVGLGASSSSSPRELVFGDRVFVNPPKRQSDGAHLHYYSSANSTPRDMREIPGNGSANLTPRDKRKSNDWDCSRADGIPCTGARGACSLQ